MEVWQLRIIAETITSDQWDIITCALAEFLNSDRWDEFDYEEVSGMFNAFEGY